MYVGAGRAEGLTMRLYKNISENLSKDREFSALNFLNQISAQKRFVKICFQIEKKIQIYFKVGNGGGSFCLKDDLQLGILFNSFVFNKDESAVSDFSHQNTI